jgi:hypothetical protein
MAQRKALREDFHADVTGIIIHSPGSPGSILEKEAQRGAPVLINDTSRFLHGIPKWMSRIL